MDTKFSFTLTPPKGSPVVYAGNFADLSDTATDDLLREIRAALTKAAGKEIELPHPETPPGMARIEK
jgi:hypothetical protein